MRGNNAFNAYSHNSLMDMKKFFVSGVLSGIVIAIIWMLTNVLVSIIWPTYDVLKLGGMRLTCDPVMLLFFFYPWIYGFIMTYAYQKIESVFKGSYVNKGKAFGLLMWLVIVIPSAFVVYTSMDYPIAFTFNQIIGGLIQMLAAGIVIAWVNK